jgi:hypothetical protein
MILAISGGTWIPFFSNPNNSRSIRSRFAQFPLYAVTLCLLSFLPLMDFGSAGFRSQDVVAIGRVRNQGRILGR